MYRSWTKSSLSSGSKSPMPAVYLARTSDRNFMFLTSSILLSPRDTLYFLAIE